MSVMQRGNQWCLRKRVPARFQAVETRTEVWISLQTDSKRAAVEKAPAVWNAQLSAWEAQLAGNSDDASEQFEAAQKLAAAQGLRYLPLEEVINLPIEPLLERIESIRNRPDPAKTAAVLGAAPVPTITVTQALEALLQ